MKRFEHPIVARPSHKFVGAVSAFVLALIVVGPAPAFADEGWSIPAEVWSAEETWRLDVGLTFSRFEQQVKSEIGGVAGERLVEETQFGLAVLGSYRIWGPFSLGLYGQYDVGFRSSGRFVGFDESGAAVTESGTGGMFHELWLGPLLRIQYWTLFVEAAWAPVGLRWDDGRDDLPNKEGETDGPLQTSLGIAWYVGVGGGIPINDWLQVVLRLEYRVRYYTSRGGDALADGVAHGTQNLTPFIGTAFTW